MADGQDVLIIDVPDRLFGADWINEMNMSSRKAGRMRAVEFFNLDAFNFFTWQWLSRVAAQVNGSVGKLR